MAKEGARTADTVSVGSATEESGSSEQHHGRDRGGGGESAAIITASKRQARPTLGSAAVPGSAV